MNITIRVIVIFVLRVLGAFCHHAPSVSCVCRDGDRFLLKGRLMLLTWLLNSASGLQHLLRNAILWSGVLHANALSWKNGLQLLFCSRLALNVHPHVQLSCTVVLASRFVMDHMVGAWLGCCVLQYSQGVQYPSQLKVKRKHLEVDLVPRVEFLTLDSIPKVSAQSQPANAWCVPPPPSNLNVDFLLMCDPWRTFAPS